MIENLQLKESEELVSQNLIEYAELFLGKLN